MKRVLLILIITAFATAVNAQKGHYFHANLGAGSHGLGYNIDCNSTKSPAVGFNGELGWQWYFTNHFGVGLGAGFKNIGNRCSLDFTRRNDNLTDRDNGLTYTESVVFNSLKEKQNENVMYIPLTLYFQATVSERWRILTGVSGIYSAVVSQKYKSNKGDISVGKYFPDYDLDYSGLEDREHGVYSVSDFSGDTKLKKSVYGAGLQLIACYCIGEKRRVELTFGIYGSYRFSDQRDCNGGNIFNVENAEYIGITQSNLVDKISSTTIGGTVGVRFRVGGKEKPQPEDEQPTKPNEPEPLIVQNDDIPQQDTLRDIPPQDTLREEPQQVVVTQTEERNEPSVQPDEKPVEVVLDLPMVPMGFNSSALDEASMRIVANVAEILKTNPSKNILIVGHTCNKGSLDVNKRIGLQRAETVKNELVRRGISAERLATETRWYSEPLLPNTSDANRSKNRRVEFKEVK